MFKGHRSDIISADNLIPMKNNFHPFDKKELSNRNNQDEQRDEDQCLEDNDAEMTAQADE